MVILQWHVDNLPAELRQSELLFSSETGGFRSGSCLIARAIHRRKAEKPLDTVRPFANLSRSRELNSAAECHPHTLN